MSEQIARDFYIYENNELVAKAESITISVDEAHKKFKLENIKIFSNFHLINGPDNPYEIKFETKNEEGVPQVYSLDYSTFTGRSPVSEALDHLDYIEGNFLGITGYLNTPIEPI